MHIHPYPYYHDYVLAQYLQFGHKGVPMSSVTMSRNHMKSESLLISDMVLDRGRKDVGLFLVRAILFQILRGAERIFLPTRSHIIVSANPPHARPYLLCVLYLILSMGIMNPELLQN